jgi:MFS family permease
MLIACWCLLDSTGSDQLNSLPMVYDVGDEARIGAFTGLYYLASNIAAVGGPQVVGFLIDWTGGNYRIMFVFSAFFMLLAGLLMMRVKEHQMAGVRPGKDVTDLSVADRS